MSITDSVASEIEGAVVDTIFDDFRAAVSTRFAGALASGPVFMTDATELYGEGDLWAVFINSFTSPEERRQHDCRPCTRFIRTYGGLAIVNEDGTLASALWNEDDVTDLYKPAVAEMARRVRRAKLLKPFFPEKNQYGIPLTGKWTHFSFDVPKEDIFKETPVVNAFQAASAKREEHRSILVALQEYTESIIQQAAQILNFDSLPNSAAVVGQMEFLLSLCVARNKAKSLQAKDNAVFRLVATAPTGFCHPRASLISTLLDDLSCGKPFTEARDSWVKKMHPEHYRRKQAAATAGAIAAAEVLFEKMGAASALERRFATLDDILEKVWTPKVAPAVEEKKGGIFASIAPKEAKPAVQSIELPAQDITWSKFERTVLPTIDSLEIYIDNYNAFAGVLTAVDPQAAPLMQWDNLEQRNPVSIYTYAEPTTAEQWGLKARTYNKVTAIVHRPNMWFGKDFPTQRKGLLFLVEGCADKRDDIGNGLFPSNIRGEFHSVLTVIENYSKVNQLQGRDKANACGIIFDNARSNLGVILRVTTHGVTVSYLMSHWD